MPSPRPQRTYCLDTGALKGPLVWVLGKLVYVCCRRVAEAPVRVAASIARFFRSQVILERHLFLIRVAWTAQGSFSRSQYHTVSARCANKYLRNSPLGWSGSEFKRAPEGYPGRRV